MCVQYLFPIVEESILCSLRGRQGRCAATDCATELQRTLRPAHRYTVPANPTRDQGSAPELTAESGVRSASSGKKLEVASPASQPASQPAYRWAQLTHFTHPGLHYALLLRAILRKTRVLRSTRDRCPLVTAINNLPHILPNTSGLPLILASSGHDWTVMWPSGIRYGPLVTAVHS